MKSQFRIHFATLVLAFLLAGCEPGTETPLSPIPGESVTAAEYVGGQQCAACHVDQATAWTESHHDLAMQTADASTVLGDFDNATFQYNDVTTEFFRRGTAHWVRTDGPDGELTEYEITHAFGVEPLQQYLVELAGGAMHALSIAWDSRPLTAGGQRWFHLYPDDTVDASDPLHWTGIFQNWNSTCAECHSTNLEKNFSSATNTYATSFSSIDVDCEACHGPGSLHVATPQQAPLFLERDIDARWLFVDNATIAHREPALESREEIEACAQCHSRRSQFSDSFDPGKPFLDSYRPSLLDENLYHADGQIQDEVYVYGSFLQSPMHAAGVTCSDCHDPHSTALRFDGNALCGQCHVASTYDVTEHHHHERDTSGSLCIDCHMPSNTYMVVDPRRDHSFRVPRPDLSLELGTPNACSGCHEIEGAVWAATTVAEWYPAGRGTTDHYGQALHAGRSWAASRGQQLRDLVADSALPSIVRATAVSLLAQQLDDLALDAVDQALQTDEPLIELAALDALEGIPPEARIQPAQRYLTHSLRALRIAAARLLLPVRAELSDQRIADLDSALAEYRDAQLFNSDRAEGLFNWGSSLVQLGQITEAEAYFRSAIDRAPVFTAAYINLADIYRLQGDEDAARTLLEQAVANNPEDPGAHFALGLSLVRAAEPDEAYAELEAAAELAPNAPYYQYVTGIALNSNGDRGAAITTLMRVHERFPGHRDTLLALATIHRDGGESEQAALYARRLLALSPSDSVARGLLDEVTATTP
jgi:predicted CXXCH cytochrome family protein